MKYRKLGSSDLEVSEISLGSWLTYGVGVEADKARACLDEAFNQGINFIDTANIYGRGAAESFLGEALKGRGRDSYILATKLFFPMTESDRGLSREQVEKQLDASLKRLQTDYVDLYQCHRYDWDTPLEETMEALTRAIESGKTRYIGFSEWPAERIRAAVELAGSGRVAKLCRASRNIPSSGETLRRRSFRCAQRTAFRKSSGRRSVRACSAGNTIRIGRRRPTRGRPARR
jgi:aryl-alcohol dehydrogenase-like predicted oxidoreductase